MGEREQSFSEYLDELADASRRLRVAGLPRLSGLFGEEAEELARRWGEIDVRRRRRIVRELAELAEDNIEFNFDAVFLRGLRDEDSDVRRGAVQGLWEHEAPDIIDTLLDLLEKDEDAGVRAEAAQALGRFVMLAEEGRLRERHFRRVEEGLRRALSRAGEAQEVRARALEAIGAADEQWVRQAIIEAYESGEYRMKVSSVHAMGRSAQERWLPLIAREMSNEEPELRYEAAIAAGQLADERMVPHLVRLIVDPDEEVKEAAIMALGEIGGRQAKQALITLLDSESEAVREAAREALEALEFEEDPLSFRRRF